MTGIRGIMGSQHAWLRRGAKSAAGPHAMLHAELARGYVRRVPDALLTSACLAVLVVAYLFHTAKLTLLFWIFGLYVVTVLRYVIARSAQGHACSDAAVARACHWLLPLGAVSAIWWGALPFIEVSEATVSDALITLLVLAAVPAGSIAPAAFLPAAFIVSALPIASALGIALTSLRPTGWGSMLLLSACYLLYLGKIVLDAHRVLRGAIFSRLTRHALDDELDRQRQELADKNVALESALQEARRANSVKSEFLAKMSHEMRTPVNGIMGMTSLAMDQLPAGEQRDSLLAVTESAKQLLALINDILDHSKIEAGKLTLDVVPTDLAHIVGTSRRLFEVAAAQQGVTLEVEIAPEVPTCVLADPLRIGQVLNNLLSNAIKFTPRGGIVALTVTADAKEHGVRVYSFTVLDTGSGIAPERQLTIFDAFVQADSSVTRRHGGSGLGLTISANLAALMGGAITLESEIGKGSTFTFRVPLPEASTQEVDQQNRRDAGISTGGESISDACSGIRVLVAEDNPTNQKLCQKMLEKAGFEVLLAVNGKEALNILGSEAVDVVLMDCQMPVLDGYEATRLLRAHADPRIARIPIIALTAHAMEGDRKKCIEAGMNEYVTKPFDRAQLLTLIRRLADSRVTV